MSSLVDITLIESLTAYALEMKYLKRENKLVICLCFQTLLSAAKTALSSIILELSHFIAPIVGFVATVSNRGQCREGRIDASNGETFFTATM